MGCLRYHEVACDRTDSSFRAIIGKRASTVTYGVDRHQKGSCSINMTINVHHFGPVNNKKAGKDVALPAIRLSFKN
jgi:hypothetical protein